MSIFEAWFCCVVPGEKKCLFVQTVYKAEEVNCRVGETQWKLAWEFWILAHPAEAVGFT